MNGHDGTERDVKEKIPSFNSTWLLDWTKLNSVE